MSTQRTDEGAVDHATPTAPSEPEEGRRQRGLLRWILAPLSGVLGVAGRIFHSGTGSTNALHHGVTNALHHKATHTLGHEPVSALGHEAVGTTVTDSAASAGTTPPQGQGSSPGPAGVGAAVVAVVVAAIAAIALTRGDEPELDVAQPQGAAPTTAAPAVEPPASGPGLFATAETDTVAGNVFAGADLGSDGRPLVVTAVEGAPSQIGLPANLASGATVAIDADGTFRYDPSGAFQSLGSGQTTTDQFTYTASNGADWSEDQTATVTVTGVNDAPSLDEVAPISTEETASMSVEVTAADPDLDTLTFAFDQSAPPFVTLTETGEATTLLSVVPGPGDSGVYQVTITATDAGSPPMSDMVTVAITVTAPLARITDGLLVLYEFDEGSGSNVADTSGIGSPLDLSVVDPEAVRWSEGSLLIESPTILISDAPDSKIWDSVSASNGLTIEAWISPANATQNGPARVVSVSADITSRNVTLAQGGHEDLGGDYWTARLRSTTTSPNGLPSLSTPSGTATATQLTHLVLTRSSSGDVKVYVDGKVIATGTVGGDFSNWDGAHPLLLANETSGDRPWLGAFHLVAVYRKALSPSEVDQNHQVGP